MATQQFPVAHTLIFILSTLLLRFDGIDGFVTAPKSTLMRTRNAVDNNNQHIASSPVPSTVVFAGETGGDNGVIEASLAGLGDDHEAVGENMAKSVAAWLDDEWMPQEVHIRMGVSVKSTYIQCRQSGTNDVASIMTQVTDDLFERWGEYDKDAFVNAWDIGNYVSDYLISKSGSETCGCSNQIYE